ncbi:hypothetical protein FRC07_000869, partial [Ceratobasidium sp. 392]
SDFDYVLPDIDIRSLTTASPAPHTEKELAQVPEEPISPVKPKRALPFGRRRGSASSGVIVAAASSAANSPRPFSEALDTFMTRKQQDGERDRDLDRTRGGEAPPLSPTIPESITSKNVKSPSTPTTTTRPAPTATTLEDLDSGDDDDDDPLVPPPPRASVFGGYAYSDKDLPARSQSLPDVDRDRDSDMVRSESGHSRPPRPQVHPHQLARGKNKSGDLNSLLVASAPTPMLGTSSAASDTAAAPVKTKQKDASTRGGLFSWRSKSSKEVPAAVAPIVTDPAESSFSLKSFRHVGPTSVPSSPVGQSGSVLGSSTNVNTAGISANTPATTTTTSGTITTTSAIVSTPPSSYGRSSPAPGMRPVPGRTGVTRERVNSTGSEGVMTAGLFRQAARRSNTNLVEDAGTSPRSSVAGIRDREKRGPPTRSWDLRDKDGGDASSGSDRVPARPSRAGRPGEGPTSDRSELGVGGKPRTLGRSSSAMPSVGSASTGGDSSPEGPSPFASALSKLGEEDPLTRSGYEGGPARSEYARARSTSPTKPRQSAPTAMGRSPPIRTTIPTKTNDGPSIKSRASSPIKMGGSGRPPSPARSIMSNRSITSSPTRSMAGSPTKSMTGSPTKSVSSAAGLPIKSSMRRSSVETTATATGYHSRYASVDTYRAKSPGADLHRAKSPGAEMYRAKSPSVDMSSRAKSPAPSYVSRTTDVSRAKSPGPTPRTGYVPPPRQSSLAHLDVDSDEDESEDPEVESEDEELGFSTRQVEKKVAEKASGELGALRRRGASVNSSPFASRQGSGSNTGHDGLTRERTITQRTADSGRASPTRDEDQPPKPPPKVGVSLFDRPVPSSSSSLSSSPFDKFGTPPASVTPSRGIARGRASHSTSAISAAATARNSAAIADANRRLGPGHNRGASNSTTTPGRPSNRYRRGRG